MATKIDLQSPKSINRYDEGLKSKAKIVRFEPKQFNQIIPEILSVMKECYKDETTGTFLFKEMTQDQINAFLTDPNRIQQIARPRLEIRKAQNGDIIQIMMMFQTKSQRDLIYQRLALKKKMEVNICGESSLDIRPNQVTKALAINFLEHHFDEILDQMGYRANPFLPIQAHLTKTIVIADGDGTIYDGHAPRNNFKGGLFADSPAKQAIFDYLEAGGILAICSGTALERIRARFLEGFPPEKRHLLSNIMLFGSGGANLATFAPNTQLIEFFPYRKYAFVKTKKNQPVPKIDAVYIGNDEQIVGNDYPAFKKMGFDHAICVTNRDPEKIPTELQTNAIASNMSATSAFLDSATEFAYKNPGQKLFTPEQISQFVSKSRSTLQEYQKKEPVSIKHLAVFSGGSGPRTLVPYLSEKFGLKNVKYIIPNTDDGGSTGILIRSFPSEKMFGFGDFRNRIVSLCQDKSFKKLISKRLSMQPLEAESEWKDLLNGTSDLFQNINLSKKETILKALSVFHEKCQQLATPFDFRNANIGNLILAGLWLMYFRNTQVTLNEFADLADIPSDVVVPSSMDQDCTLAAKLLDGTKIMGQDAISHPSHDNTVNKETAENLPAPLKKIHIIQRSKIQKQYLSALESLSEVKCTQKPNPRAIHVIRNADMLVFSRGSIGTSIIPALLPTGMGEEIIHHHGKKVLMINGNIDRETSGLSLSDYVRLLVTAMNKNKPLVNPAEMTQFITDVIIPAGSPFQKEEEIKALEKHGLKITIAPAQKMSPNSVWYDDAKLSEILSQL